MFHGVCRAASCEITVQISPWQSGSYSASLYSRLSRSGVTSFPPRPSHRVSRYYLSLLCAPCALQHAFSPLRGGNRPDRGRQSDHRGQRLRSIREISTRRRGGRRSTSVLRARNGERYAAVSLHTDNCDAFRRITPALQPCSLREREREEIRIGRTFFFLILSLFLYLSASQFYNF